MNDCCIAKMSTTLFLNCTLYVINQFKKTGMLNMYNLDFQFVKTTGGNDSCLSPPLLTMGYGPLEPGPGYPTWTSLPATCSLISAPVP